MSALNKLLDGELVKYCSECGRPCRMFPNGWDHISTIASHTALVAEREEMPSQSENVHRNVIDELNAISEVQSVVSKAFDGVRRDTQRQIEEALRGDLEPEPENDYDVRVIVTTTRYGKLSRLKAEWTKEIQRHLRTKFGEDVTVEWCGQEPNVSHSGNPYECPLGVGTPNYCRTCDSK